MHDYSDEFQAFWACYPRRVARFAAQRAYARARKTATAQEILDGLRRYREHKPAYADWAHAASWLNSGRWLDEYETVPEPDSSEANQFLARFCELYSKHRHGARYHVQRPLHVALVKALLETYERERLEKLAVILLTTNDDWVSSTDRGVGILSVKVAWLEGLLAEYEAKRLGAV